MYIKKKRIDKKVKIKFPKLSMNLSILKTKQSIWILTTLLLFSIGLLLYQTPIFKTNTENILTSVQQTAVFRSPNNSFYIPNLIIIVLILASLVIIIQRSIKLYKVSKQK